MSTYCSCSNNVPTTNLNPPLTAGWNSNLLDLKSGRFCDSLLVFTVCLITFFCVFVCRGDTALHKAASEKQHAVCRLLVEAGALLEKTNFQVKTRYTCCCTWETLGFPVSPAESYQSVSLTCKWSTENSRVWPPLCRAQIWSWSSGCQQVWFVYSFIWRKSRPELQVIAGIFLEFKGAWLPLTLCLCVLGSFAHF